MDRPGAKDRARLWERREIERWAKRWRRKNPWRWARNSSADCDPTDMSEMQNRGVRRIGLGVDL